MADVATQPIVQGTPPINLRARRRQRWRAGHLFRAARSGCCRACKGRIQPGDWITAGPVLRPARERPHRTYLHARCLM